MTNLSPQQKIKLTKLFPELGTWFEQQSPQSNPLMPLMDSLIMQLISKIDFVKGEKGDKGDMPVKGKDYLTDTEINQLISRILKQSTPIKGVHYNDGKKGDAYILTLKDKKEIASQIDVPVVDKVVERTEIIKEVSKNLTVEDIKGAVSKKELDIENKKILDGMVKIDGRIKAVDMRWHGGGLSKVSTDTTLTGNGTSSSPLSVVGGGSFSGLQEKSLTTPNGSTQTFAFTHTPKMIFWGGALQFLNTDYTVSGTSITFTGTLTPLSGDIILNLY
jgi:hypothetical protein